MFAFDKFCDRVAIVTEYGDTITYAQLMEQGEAIAEVIGTRCLVFCLCKNMAGAVIGYTAFLNHRIVPVLLNAGLERDMLDGLLDLYHPSYLWIPAEMEEAFPKWQVVYSGYGYSLIRTSYETYYELYEELCLMLTTSGSTGSPKFVRQSYGNVFDNASSIVQYLGIDASERPITTLPMNYTYGLSIINSHLLVGATLLMTEKGLMQKEFWKFFKEENATSFGGVPYTYEMLDRLRFYRMELPSLRYCTQAGGKLTPELHLKFAQNAAEKGFRFVVMYGQCEATARMGYLPAEKAVEKCGSMGIAIPGGSFQLIDGNGNVIENSDVTGELVYTGKNVTLGYAECGADLIKGDERGGVLHTGDMAKRDADGFYYIVGRKKRFLKIYGNRVNLDEIDRMIKAKFDYIDCASAGIDDHMYLFVTDERVKEQVKEYVVTKTKLNPAAFKTIVIDEIPKNDAGKVLYKELVKYYE